ncbi:MAG TPA: UDP-N-acetylmuramoyl-tripeptide--D-alanyl-D-alanine ligase [Candidatus Eisenbacteria bacterium]|nr:UDP-N-acetylmuramoyl-tripeptide--D-alanyl-D-alanine ligase [Candidatus Eisenbacteria bacterium]
MKAVGGTAGGWIEGVAVRGVSTDTRTLREGDLFVALRGPNFDGHAFLRDAFARGAAAALVEEFDPAGGAQVKVADARAALGLLASQFRAAHPARFLSVSGSNGKTTTKEMLAHILSGRRRVVRAPASFNNDLGVPLTIFSAQPDTEFVVLELGTNKPGEIDALGRIARPDAAVVTSIGEEHLEGLGSVEGVAAEEAAILDHVRAGGFVVAPADSAPFAPHLERVRREKLVTFGFGPSAHIKATDLASNAGGVRFRALGVAFELPLQGSWNALNALAASAAAMAFGMDLAECAGRLRDFRAPKMRMELLTLGGVSILNDAYNSNPASAALAVADFGNRLAAGRKIAVLGDMRELGSSSTRHHLELGRAVAREATIQVVLLVGPEARAMEGTLRDDQERRCFDAVEEARAAVMEIVRPGDCLLLKGSRAVGLEKIVKYVADKVTQTRSGNQALVG